MGKVGHGPKIGHCCPLSAIHTLCTAYTCTMRIVILLGTSILVSWYIRGGIKLCCDHPPPLQKKKWLFILKFYDLWMDKYSTCASSWSMGSLEQSDLVTQLSDGYDTWEYFVALFCNFMPPHIQSILNYGMKALLKQTWSGVWYIEWKVVIK